MQPATKVFEIRTSLESGRPEIDFELSENAQIDWGFVGQVLEGSRPIQDYSTIHISVQHPEATDWDFYSCAGTFGIFSQKVVDLIGADAFNNFELIPAQVNGKGYFFLKCIKRIDCFDRDKAEFIPFDGEPIKIMTIQKYMFKLDKIDAKHIFCIPENENIYCSEGHSLLFSNTLKGFRLIECQ
jgi:hypothetical protein